MSEVLGLRDAAKFLKMKPETLAKEALAGRIPGAKPATHWVFLVEDLKGYIRSLYAREAVCRSLNVEPSGKFHSLTQQAKKLDKVLERQTGGKHRNSMTT